MSDLRVITEPLGGAALARQAIGRASVVAPWYTQAPATAEEWRAHTVAIREEFDGRNWLAALAGALSARGAAAARLQRCAGGAGVVVTTGQQAGLFGGAIYTWSKAVSALALADALEARTGVPVAPVFWAATDDSDYEEARWTKVAVPGGVETLRLGDPAIPGASMSAMPLPDVSDLLARLERGAGSVLYREILDQVRDAYAPGATVGDAFVTLLRSALEPFGIAVLDASHVDVRRASFPVVRRALERASGVGRALAERGAAIAAAGFKPQVAAIEGLTLVFSSADGRVVRSRVPLAAASTVASRARETDLGPNVLLRPIVERSILPTVAYCGGPGELAYFAQVSAVSEALDTAPPLAVPRWSGTIVEPHVARILGRLELTVEDLRDPHRAERRLARRAVPSSVVTALAGLERALDDAVRSVADAVASASSPPLVPGAVLEGAHKALENRLRRLERRILAAVKRREHETMRDLATARGALFPDGKRQERTLNFIPMLARRGSALLALMLEAAREHASVLAGASLQGDASAALAGGATVRGDDAG